MQLFLVVFAQEQMQLFFSNSAAATTCLVSVTEVAFAVLSALNSLFWFSVTMSSAADAELAEIAVVRNKVGRVSHKPK